MTKMDNEHIYDAVIVGAGPAGLMLGRKLNEGDLHNFLIIESKNKVGEPLRCGEGIGCSEFSQFFPKKEYSFIANKVYSHDIIYEDLTRKFQSEFYQLDRPLFEKWLSEEIKDKIKLNVKCLDVTIYPEYALVLTDKGNIKAKVVALCHGNSYNIQKKFGMSIKNQLIIPCYGGIYKNYNLSKDKFYFIFDKYPGAMWVFPKDEKTANIGIGLYKHDINIKEFFNHLMKKYKIDAEMVSEYSGSFPASGPIKKTYSERLIACGNAAGFVFAGTGEGIYYALKSGEIAGEVLLECINKNKFSENELREYEKEWKKSFYPKLKAGIIFLDLLEIGYKFNKMKRMFGSPSQDELKGMILDGKVPYRAKVLWRLSKIFNLKNKKKIPLLFRLVYRLCKGFRIIK